MHGVLGCSKTYYYVNCHGAVHWEQTWSNTEDSEINWNGDIKKLFLTAVLHFLQIGNSNSLCNWGQAMAHNCKLH